MRPLVAIAIAAAAAVGCHRGPARCTPGDKPKLELRNGSGALTLAWKHDALCDAGDQLVGTLQVKKDTVTLRDANGKLRLELVRESNSDARGGDDEGPQLRLYRGVRELRLMRADGVPLGSVVPESATAATVYNPASAPLAKVSMRDRDAVVTDMAGTALTYVHPARNAGAAGVFALPSVDPAEQLALYIYWSR